jgi:prepilin-type N-terminal cleavage/methylation domain-containing protein
VRKCVKKTEGFTLVEIIVASVLLALIAAGIFSITLSSRKLINLSQRRHFANEVAQAVMENLRQYLGADYWYNNTESAPLCATANWKCYDFNDNTNSLTSAISSKFGSSEFASRYGAQWCYKVETEAPPYDYRKVTAMVNWTEPTP